MWSFFQFPVGFRSSQSTAVILTVVSGRIARAFNKSGTTRAVIYIYIKLLTGFGMLVYLKNLCLMEFEVRYLALFLLISVIDDFKWFWMGSLDKNIQLMLELLKAPFLVLHFFFYILMTFLMMLSVILLSMMMILLSNVSVIRHLICGNNLNWLLNLNLIYDTLWLGQEMACWFQCWENSTDFVWPVKFPRSAMR